MKGFKHVSKQLQRLSQSYDEFFRTLNESTKATDTTYKTSKHIKNCIKFLVRFIKNQNAIIRGIIFLVTLIFPAVFTWMKIKEVRMVESISFSTFFVVATLLFILLCWWVDRRTLLQVTNPEKTNDFFHIGAYEKYRNQEFKRHFDYFYKGSIFSFRELKEEVDELKNNYEIDEEFYEHKLKKKDKLLIDSLANITMLQKKLNEYGGQHIILTKIFEETLLALGKLSEQKLTFNEMDFHYHYTVHQMEKNQYKILYSNHPHPHKVHQDFSRDIKNHLYKAERLNGALWKEEELFSFVLCLPKKEKWVITLYPKTKGDVQNPSNYDKLYIEDVVALWNAFVKLLIQLNEREYNKGVIKDGEKQRKKAK